MASADEPTMVERVARALCRVSCRDLSCLDCWDWKSCNNEARAAIAAMRQPTEAMWAVQDDVRYLRDMWAAMIDAALKEPGHD